MDAVSAESTYKQLLENVRSDDQIVGLILAGSRAKNLQKDSSDYDVYMILKDSSSEESIHEYRNTYNEKYKSLLNLDLSNKAIQTVEEFRSYAIVGSEYAWDRYHLVHTIIEVDTLDGEIIKLAKAKATLSESEAKAVIESNLGAYVNLTYRAVKSSREKNTLAALLDAAETINYLLHVIFALSNRIRPFNKYLEWELTNYPLDSFGLSTEVLLDLLKRIATADTQAMQTMYEVIEEQAKSKGYAGIYDAWDGKLDYIKQN